MTNRDDKLTGGAFGEQVPEHPIEAQIDLHDDLALEAMFEEAREAVMLPSADLLAAIMADADSEIARRVSKEAARRAAARPKENHPIVAAVVAALGGWRAVAGLATAGIVGLAIGFGAPATVTSLATGGYSVSYSDNLSAEVSSGNALDDLVPSFYDLAAEG